MSEYWLFEAVLVTNLEVEWGEELKWQWCFIIFVVWGSFNSSDMWGTKRHAYCASGTGRHNSQLWYGWKGAKQKTWQKISIVLYVYGPMDVYQTLSRYDPCHKSVGHVAKNPKIWTRLDLKYRSFKWMIMRNQSEIALWKVTILRQMNSQGFK